MAINLNKALKIDKGDVVTLVGAGGKTSVLKILAEEINENVIITTTTHIQSLSNFAENKIMSENYGQISENIDKIQNRAKRLRDKLYNIDVNRVTTDITKDASKTGGGAFPVQEIPTFVTRVQVKDMNLNDLSYKLRMNNPPIFTRLKDDYMLFDLRTIKEEEIDIIVAAFNNIL